MSKSFNELPLVKNGFSEKLQAIDTKITQAEGAATIDLLNTENNQEAPINCRLPEKLFINEDDFLEGVTEEQIVEHLQGSLNWLCEFSEHINSYSSLEQFDSLEDAVEGVQVNSDTVVECFKQTDTFMLSNRNSKPLDMI